MMAKLSSVCTLVLLLPLSQARGLEIEPGHKFAQVVQAHFAEWDLNHDGRLEAQEIDRLMNRHTIRGEEAAALATIKLRERTTPVAERAHFATSLAQLAGRAGSQGGAIAADPARGGPHPFSYEAHFRLNLKVLGTLVPRLFAGNQPDFRAMKQGAIGDCYFFSLTDYLAAREPRKIVRMIVPEPGGNFTVRFFDGEVIPVSAPTEAEMLVNNSASSLSDGYWLCVLEKAVGKRMRATTKNQAKRTAEATDAMAAGGSTKMMIKLYSGHRSQAIKLRDSREAARRLSELRRELPTVLARGMLAGVEMNRAPPASQAKVPGLGYNHAYAILDYAPRTDLVSVWNPWGRNFTPKGPAGVEHGFVTEHGVFQIPLTTLYHQFSTVHLETIAPSVPRAHLTRSR